MNAKYYPLIKLSRKASVMKRRFTLPFKLLSSGFVRSESFYPEMPQKSRLLIALELLGHIMWYGRIEWYYFSYGLDIKGFRDKREFLDDSWFLWKCAMLNTVLTDYDYTCILRDKALFGTLLMDWGFNTPHTIATIKTEEDAERVANQLMNGNGTYFCKPLDGECGGGVFRLMVEDGKTIVDGEEQPLSEAKSFLMDHFSQRSYVVQTLVVQHPEMSRVYDKAVNTLRILTVMDKDTGKSVSVAGEVRFGAHGSVADNLAAGGVAVGVDLKTGQLSEYGICKYGGAKSASCHPDTLVPFAEVRIPFIREAVQQAEALHERLSSIRMIGWDIAITESGPVFIEGNDNPEISGLQTVNGGLKTKIKNLLGKDFEN